MARKRGKKKERQVVDESRVVRDKDAKTITCLLREPLQRQNGEPISEITLRRPKLGDIEIMDDADGDNAGMVLLIAALSDLPVKLVRDIDMLDFGLVGAVLEEMMEGKSEGGTGEDSQQS